MSARANAHITREQLVWIASRLAVNPMMKSRKSGSVIPEPSWKLTVSATGSATSPLMDGPEVGDREYQRERGVGDDRRDGHKREDDRLGNVEPAAWESPPRRIRPSRSRRRSSR